MEKLIYNIRNYILPGAIGLAAALIVVVKEIQLLLWINYPTVIESVNCTPVETIATVVIVGGALFIILKNIHTWWTHKYAMSLLLLLEGSALATALVITFTTLTMTILYVVISLVVLQVAAATFLVITDYNFVDGGHKQWIKPYSRSQQ